MIQRLFFYGIHRLRGGFAVNRGVQKSPAVFPDLAQPAPLRPYHAAMAAQVALNDASLAGLPEHGFFKVHIISNILYARREAMTSPASPRETVGEFLFLTDSSDFIIEPVDE